MEVAVRTIMSEERANSTPPRCLLIVEPQALLKWSLVKYLSKWFEILVADNEGDAQCFLNEHDIEAVVLSDELPEHTVRRIETRAKALNPSVQLVRTVADAALQQEVLDPNDTAYCLEKPFALSKMAELLGIDEQKRTSEASTTKCSESQPNAGL